MVPDTGTCWISGRAVLFSGNTRILPLGQQRGSGTAASFSVKWENHRAKRLPAPLATGP